MVPDPYKALELSHDATADEIKKSYRRLALRYHPDRLVRRGAAAEEFHVASIKFTAIASAYSVLSDPRRKREYDHIYKYGGYDDDNDENIKPMRQQSAYGNRANTSEKPHGRGKKRSKGIGYNISDPVSYFFPSLAKSGQQAVAGIQIPSRIHLANPSTAGRGLRFAFSSGQYTTSKTGSKKFTSNTTQFAQGKKFTRKETTTVHPDGRKEIIIEGNNFVQRKWTNPTRRRPIPKNIDSDDVTSVNNIQPDHIDEPWYMNAWNSVRERVSICMSHPCAGIMAQ